MSKKFHLPPNAFPPLVLANDEKRWLRDEMNAVVAETMRVERQFLDPRDGRAVFPKTHYRAVRSRDDFVVYKERRAKRRAASDMPVYPQHDMSSEFSSSHSTGISNPRAFSVDSQHADEMRAAKEPTSVRSASSGSAACSSSLGDDPESIVMSMKEPHVPMLLGAGVVDGSLDDTLFGALAGDDLAWRLRTTYVKDKFADARILAKIDGPTAEDPFRSLCIKWFTKEVPALVGSFIQRRDFLILEATGTGVESDGTRFGYYMIHSIKLPSVPELVDLNVIRCKVSLCFISRERSPRSSHLFVRGFSDARGEMMESVAVQLTAESIISATLVVECATVKKLTWLMQKQQRVRQERIQTSANSPLPSECQACQRTVQKFSLSKHHACQACGLLVCSKCIVQKRLVVDVTGDGVVERQLTFCFGCVMEAKRTASWEVASDLERLDPKHQQRHRSTTDQRSRPHTGSMHRASPPTDARAPSVGIDFSASRSNSVFSTRPTATRSQSTGVDFSASRSNSMFSLPPTVRSQSAGVDFSASRSNSMFAQTMRPSTTSFTRTGSMDSTSESFVRPHARKSGAGVVLY